MTSSPIRYRADVEVVQPNESDVIRDLNSSFDVILERTAEDYDHGVRSVHAKSHGIMAGTLTIDPDLSSELAQGVFASAGTHAVFIRLSTNAGDLLPDAISLPRGMAIKVLDVDGDRLPGAEGRTQDFILVNAPVFQAKTAEKFLGNLKLLAKTTDRIEGTKTVVSAALRGVRHALEAVGVESPAVNTLGGAPNSEPLGETYYSATPFRYGEYIAKFRVRPLAPAQVALTGQEIDPKGRRNAIREEVRAQMQGMAAEWEFAVQLCRDLDRQPVEDPTVVWDESEAPFQRVGTIRAERQDSWEPQLVRQVNEEMRFSIWTGLAAHQPLGNINRARRETYRHSADFRARINACPYHEPSGAAD